MALAPCKGCTKRELGCHDRCEEYQTFKKEYAEVKEMIRKNQGIPLYPTRLKKNYLI